MVERFEKLVLEERQAVRAAQCRQVREVLIGEPQTFEIRERRLEPASDGVSAVNGRGPEYR